MADEQELVCDRSMVSFPMTLSDPYPRFQVHRVTIDALDVLCA